MEFNEHLDLGDGFVATKLKDVNGHTTYWLSEKGNIFSMYCGTKYPYNKEEEMIEMVRSCIPILKRVMIKKE